MAALAASPFYYRQIFFRVEEEVRARIEAKLAERFPQMEVHVRGARLVSGGIEIRGVSIVEPGATGPKPELAFLDEVFIACPTDLQELVAGDPQIDLVKLTRPVFRATRRPDGKYGIDKLMPLNKPNRPLPPFVIENGVVEVSDLLKQTPSTYTLRDIHITLQTGDGGANADDNNQLKLEGYVTGDYLQRVEIVGQFDPASSRWSISGTADRLEISPELRDALPEPVALSLEQLPSIRAPANLSFRVTSDGTDAPPQFDVNGTIDGGRIDDPRLPYPLTDLSARVHCDNSGIRVRDLRANHGRTTWEVPEFDRRGYRPDSPCALRATGRQVRLDPGWRDLMPPAWKKHWTHYEPAGEVNFDCSLSFDGQKWKPWIQLTCLNNASFSCYKFPYRLERGRGTLTLEGNQLHINLVAFSGAQPVTLRGSFRDPGPNYSGKIEIWGEKIQFDEKLFAAILKPKQNKAIRSLDPRGTFDFHTVLWREPNDPLPRPRIHQHTHVSLNRCTVTYEKLPYPLHNLQGKLEMIDGQWKTESPLVGANDTGVVKVAGDLSTSPEGDLLNIHFDAQNVPLEEELRDALPPAQRQIWNALRPRGSIDFVAAVVYDSRVRKPSIDLWLVPHGGTLPAALRAQSAPSDLPLASTPADQGGPTPAPHSDQVTPRSDGSELGTSIAPVVFPYRMERLGGLVHYHDGHVELKDVRARHGATKMRTDGWCDFFPNGSWKLRLERLSVDRARLHGGDQELVAALPAALRGAVAELRPTGPINLMGILEFSKDAVEAPLRTGWDVDLFLHQTSLQVGPQLDNVFGAVRLRGGSDGKRFSSFGELKLDSLTYKNFQFTEILGPLWFDQSDVYLGTLPHAMPNGQKSGRVTAKLYGGVVAADCHVQLGAVPQYRLIASLSNADLARFAAENMTTQRTLNGRVLANVDLQGSRGQHTLVGTGNVHLSEANIYELPLIVSLLKIVRARAPDSTAFTESDITFRINGPHVTLTRIDLRGDALDLSGHGELKLDGQANPIQLDLHTTVGRGAIPLISGMFSEASQQILKIRVEGPLDRPQTWTEAVPMVGEALERLRADYEEPARAPQASSAWWPFGPR